MRSLKIVGAAAQSPCVEMLESRVLFDVTVNQVKDILDGTGSGFYGGLAGSEGTLGSFLYFVGNNAKGRELWRSGGTKESTKLVKDIADGPASSDPAFFTKIGNRIYFVAGDANSNREIWYTDGTNTKKVSNLQSSPSDLIAVDDVLFFLASVNGANTLHRLKGDNVSTIPMPPSDENVLPLAAVNGKLLFRYSDNANASDDEHNTEVWVVGKSGDNPHVLKDLAAGDSSNPYQFITVNDTVYFLASSGKGNNRTTRLFQTNGTASGTMQVKNFGDTFPGSFDSAADVGGELFFGFRPGGGVNELWKADPDTGNATLIKKFSSDGSILGITEVSGAAFFSAVNAKGRELWTSDGETTSLVLDINENGDGHPNQFVNFNGTVYFSADDGVHGSELWSSDGTEEGTTLVQDIDPGQTQFGPNSSFPGFTGGFTKIGTSLYFGAITAASGQELYRLNSSEMCLCPTPDVSIDVEADDFTEGERVRFVARLNNEEVEVLRYRWDFENNGTFDFDSKFNEAVFTYADNRTNDAPYTVRVRVRLASGEHVQATAKVPVKNFEPVPRDISIFIPPNKYETNKVVPPKEPLLFLSRIREFGKLDKPEAKWDFGDGTVTKFEPAENGAAAVHEYADIGTHKVVITVRDKDGAVGTLERNIFTLRADVFMAGFGVHAFGGGAGLELIARTSPKPKPNPQEFSVLAATDFTQEVEVISGGKSLGTFDADSVEFVCTGNRDNNVKIDPDLKIPVLIDGGAGDDTIRGGGGPDNLIGGKGNDVLLGRGGADRLEGGKGDDDFDGGKGKDEIVDPENVAAAFSAAALVAPMSISRHSRMFSIENLFEIDDET